jgi:hypothetical protein
MLPLSSKSAALPAADKGPRMALSARSSRMMAGRGSTRFVVLATEIFAGQQSRALGADHLAVIFAPQQFVFLIKPTALRTVRVVHGILLLLLSEILSQSRCRADVAPGYILELKRRRKETKMRETTISLPHVALVAGTRVMLGAGLGLLLGDRLTDRQKQAAGWALFLTGVVTTLPLALEVWGRSRKV